MRNMSMKPEVEFFRTFNHKRLTAQPVLDGLRKGALVFPDFMVLEVFGKFHQKPVAFRFDAGLFQMFQKIFPMPPSRVIKSFDGFIWKIRRQRPAAELINFFHDFYG